MEALNKHRLSAAIQMRRWAVYCWETVADYAHSQPASAVVEVFAPTAELAQDHARAASPGAYEGYEAHAQDGVRLGMKYEDFCNHFAKGNQ